MDEKELNLFQDSYEEVVLENSFLKERIQTLKKIIALLMQEGGY